MNGLSCGTCPATFIGDPTAACPVCGQGPLTPAELRAHGEPERVVPTALDPSSVAAAVGRAAAAVPYACGELRGPALAERASLSWWPVWLVDAQVKGSWQGRAGTDYEVQSSHEVFRNGHWTTEPHVDTRIRWAPRVGDVDVRIDNAAVQALRDAGLWEKRLGGFDLQRSRRASEAPAAGLIRLPDLVPEAARDDADRAFRSAAAQVVHEAMAADHSDDIVVHIAADALNWTWLLVPVWTTWYTDDDGRRRTLWLHGLSGQVWGPLMASRKKGYLWSALWFLLGCGLLAGSAVVGLIGIILIPLLVVALIGGCVGLLFLLLAIHPLYLPYSHNQGQAREHP